MKITHYLCFLLFLIGVCTNLNAQMQILEGESKHYCFDSQPDIFVGVAKETISYSVNEESGKESGRVYTYYGREGFYSKRC